MAGAQGALREEHRRGRGRLAPAAAHRLHRPLLRPPRRPDTAQEETADAFDALVRAGKVRAIGASNFTAERLRSALEISARDGLASYVALQPHYT